MSPTIQPADPSILVARHLKQKNEIFSYRASPQTQSMIAGAIRIAERIMHKIDALVSS